MYSDIYKDMLLRLGILIIGKFYDGRNNTSFYNDFKLFIPFHQIFDIYFNIILFYILN